VHNGIELTLGNVLILLIGLGVTYGMARAPKSLLKLMSHRYQGIGLDTPPSWLVTLVRNFGRFVFFTLVNGLLLMLTPSDLSSAPWISLVTLVLAIGISVFALRKSGKRDLYNSLSDESGTRPPTSE
jgi:hypothetical protein